MMAPGPRSDSFRLSRKPVVARFVDSRHDPPGIAIQPVAAAALAKAGTRRNTCNYTEFT